MPRHSAIFIGNGSLLTQCADAFQQAGHAVLAVLSDNAAILQWAADHHLPAISTPLDAPFSLPSDIEFDYLFSVANLKILPAALISRARRLAINFHDALLPAYAGLNATSWALMAQEGVHGVTWHEMLPAVDSGRIVRQAIFQVAEGETALSLNARCYEAGLESFRLLIEDLTRGELTLTAQKGEKSYFGRHQRPHAFGTLDLRRPAGEVEALVRALDFGQYANPLGLAKLYRGNDIVFVRSARVSRRPSSSSTLPPGTVVRAQASTLQVATSTENIVLELISQADRPPATFTEGEVLPAMGEPLRNQLSQVALGVAKAEPAWLRSLHDGAPLDIPYPRLNHPLREGSESLSGVSLNLAPDGARTAGAFSAWLSALTGSTHVSLRYCDTALEAQANGLELWLMPWVQLNFENLPQNSPSESVTAAQCLVERAHQLGPMSQDLTLRQGDHLALKQSMANIGLCLGSASAPDDLEIVLRLDATGQFLELAANTSLYASTTITLMASHLRHFMEGFSQSDSATLAEISLVPSDEWRVLDALNDTATPFESNLCVHDAIARQAKATPAQLALVCEGFRLSYGELIARVNLVSARLMARGAGPSSIVGLCLDRSPDLVVAMLAIMKTGAAYLPLDPDYPAERLAFMIQDSAAALVVCRPDFALSMNIPPQKAVDLQALENQVPPELPPEPSYWPDVLPSSPAYVIYTSGSTGQPKGVVVTHRNVANFFAGMSGRVPHKPGDRWLAVTSLSFDISVLELCWTLSRGLTVVLHTRQAVQAKASAGPEFSLFYFASADLSSPADRYRLLTEGAKFADQNGLLAIWTPERHFHAFGGLYPNPAVASAAIAGLTTRLQIRAGSCVLPLHHPIRVAEDWAFIDNISNGRVGVSFASGWQPNDFVLAPEKFADRKASMLSDIDVVRRLWRGEAVEFPGPQGKLVSIQTLPRPIQPELPVWLTAAGNPETFEQAGTLGCNLLTHLLGQTVADLGNKLALYRAAWKKAGHAGTGQVTVMLHTFIGDDEDIVRETVRTPMKNYLRSSVDLIRQAAWSFPTFVQRGVANGRSPLEVMDEQALSDNDMDALLEHAFSRYYGTSALFGTPARCVAVVAQIKAAGVDEIACLIDFGVDARVVLDHLPGIKQLMEVSRALAEPPRPASVAGDIREGAVTHLQCTPSMASMLVADSAGRAALSQLSTLLVGGEALPPDLARQLCALVPGTVMNMYGPTETTVWSTVCTVAQAAEFVPLGQAIANTTLHVRTPWGMECPALVPGELFIGGEGVTPGYLHQPKLTSERFLFDADKARKAGIVRAPGKTDQQDQQGPQDQPDKRLYRTGDLVRRHPDGALEYLGRMDLQVKIRGHRIELGEIENALMRLEGVKEAAVVARVSPDGDKFLSAYVTLRPGVALGAQEIRALLLHSLPEVMNPRTVQVLAAFPLTPNGKTDRKRLPETVIAKPSVQPATTFETTLEKEIAAIWEQVLGIPQAGTSENFFDLGGHSLLVIQVQRRLREATGREISITDMFRLPTIRALAAHLAGHAPASAVADGLSRANARRGMRTRSSLQKT